MEENETFIKYLFGNIDFCCAETETNFNATGLIVKGTPASFSNGEKFWRSECPFCGAEWIPTTTHIICSEHRSETVGEHKVHDGKSKVIREAKLENGEWKDEM